MARVIAIVEGQTEESFINNLLAHELAKAGVYVTARLMGNARIRGGIKPWPDAKRDIINHLRQDSDIFVTQMVDYYALPATGDGAWPGRAEAEQKQFAEKATTIHTALIESVVATMGGNFDSRRFIPYVVMHEYEGLLFSDCKVFAKAVGQAELAPKLLAIREGFGSPEEINDSPLTAPSKRIMNLMPGYKKTLVGPVVAMYTGLPKMRDECPHFGSWVSDLEGL